MRGYSLLTLALVVGQVLGLNPTVLYSNATTVAQLTSSSTSLRNSLWTTTSSRSTSTDRSSSHSGQTTETSSPSTPSSNTVPSSSSIGAATGYGSTIAASSDPSAGVYLLQSLHTESNTSYAGPVGTGYSTPVHSATPWNTAIASSGHATIVQTRIAPSGSLPSTTHPLSSPTDAQNSNSSWEDALSCYAQWNVFSSKYVTSGTVPGLTEWVTYTNSYRDFVTPQNATPYTTLCDGTPRAHGEGSYTYITVSGSYSKPAYTTATAPQITAPPCSIAQTDCERMWASYNLVGGGIYSKPPCPSTCVPKYRTTWLGSSLPPCYIRANEVEVAYWPVQLAEGDTCGNRSTIAPTYSGTPTASTWGTTITSPGVLVSFRNIWAIDQCSSTIGDVLTGYILSQHTSQISTQCGQYHQGGSPGTPVNFADFNFPFPASAYKCLPQCGNGVGGMANYCHTMYDNFNPQIAFPTDVFNIRPEWKSCKIEYLGNLINDPPKALSAVNAPAEPTAPTVGTGPTTPASPQQPGPTTAKPTAPAAPAASDPDAGDDPAQGGSGGDGGSSDGNTGSGGGDGGSSGDGGGSGGHDGDPSNSGAEDGGSGDGNGDSGDGGSDSGDSDSDAGGSNTGGSNTGGSNPGSDDSDPNSEDSNNAGNNGSGSDSGGSNSGGSNGGGSNGVSPNGGGSSNGGSNNGDSNSSSGGGSSGHSEDSQNAGPGNVPSGEDGDTNGPGSQPGQDVGGIIASILGPTTRQPANQPQRTPGLQSDPQALGSAAATSGAVVQLGGHQATAVAVGTAGAVQVEGYTLSAGEVATIDGHVVSNAGSKLVVDGSTAPISRITAAPAQLGAVLTGPSGTMTAFARDGMAIVAGQTLTPGQVKVIDGQTVSEASTGLVVDGRTVAFSQLASGSGPPIEGAIFTAGSATLTAVESSGTAVFDGHTLTSGQVITVDGHTFSDAGTALIIDGRTTIPFSRLTVQPTMGVVFTIGGHVYTATDLPNGDIVVDGTTLHQGGVAMTIDGVRISDGSGGLVVGRRTLPVSTLSPDVTRVNQDAVQTGGAPRWKGRISKILASALVVGALLSV